MERASLWVNPENTRQRGIISVDNVAKILLKNPFKVKGRQMTKTLKRS